MNMKNIVNYFAIGACENYSRTFQPLKMKELCSFEKFKRVTLPTIQHRIPEDPNPEHIHCRNLKISFCFFDTSTI